MSVLTAKRFQNKTEARKHLERIRWPDGPYCPHCGTVDRASRIKGGRAGLWFCNACRKQFSVTVGTVFEHSKVPLHKWLMAVHLLTASKKGISSHQLHRMLGVTYKTAWFMSHRIREAMRDDAPSPMGGEGKVVEADETFIGKPKDVFHSGYGWKKQTGTAGKRKVLSLVERGGRARSMKVEDLTADTIRDALVANVDRTSRLHTDEAQHYKAVGRGPRVRRARGCEPLRERICARRRDHQHGRGLFLHFQARQEGHLPALRRTAPTALPAQVRFSLLSSLSTRRRGRGARRQGARAGPA